MALVLRNSKTIPLTNTELDNNFVELSTKIDTKVNTSDYTSAAVLNKLVTGVMGADSGIDSSLLRGYQPLSTNTVNSVVNRDGVGNFAANIITANSFIGKATDSVHADDADRAITLSSTLVVARGGTGGTTKAEARLSLETLWKGGDTVTGHFTFLTSTLATASIRIPPGVSPSFPASGDIWATPTGLRNRVGSTDRIVAYEDSNITGTSRNVTAVVAVANGGTGSNDRDFARANLLAAKSGDNSDITSLSGLTAPLSIAQGGTGATSQSGARNTLGFVNRSGDTMAGNLTMGGHSLILGPLSTDYGKIYFESNGDSDSSLVFETGDNAGFTQEKFIWRMNGGGNGPTGPATRNVMSLNETNLLVNGGTVWHSGNDGHDSGLDADLLDEQEGSFYRNATNLNAGTLSSSRLSGSYNIDVTGTSTNITGVAAVVNGGTGANNKEGARSNLSAAKSGSNSDITSLSGLTTALSTAQGGTSVTSSGPEGNYLISNGSRWISANPNLFQTFTTGVSSPTPETFPRKNIQGFEAYNSTDFPGSYYVGLTVNGVGYQAAQIAMNWNTEEESPGGLYFRTNDDTSSIGAWTPWTTIWNEVNLPVSTSNTGSTVAKRTSSGYLFAAYYNQTSNNSENPSISQVMVTNGSDGYFRKSSVAHLTASLSGTAPINITGNSNYSNSSGYASSAGSAGSVAWANVSGRPTSVSSFTNDSGYVNSTHTNQFAKKGANSDITSISGLNTALSVGQGGTGRTTTGSAGNILVSTGSSWNSVTPEAAGLGGYPAGAVVPFYRASVPTGWLHCNGQVVSRTTYYTLWSVMGFPNSGNGSTTFNVPDLRGEFVRGLDGGRGVDVNRNLGSFQNDAFESHTHTWNYGQEQDDKGYGGSYNEFTFKPGSVSGPIGYTGDNETRPRNIALMYCIKY